MSVLLQVTSLAVAKISLLIFLKRIFVTPRFGITVIVLEAMVVAWWMGNFFGNIFRCTPVRKAWIPDTQGHCGSQLQYNIATPIPWVVTDFLILLAPLPVIKNLHLPAVQKIPVFGMFLIGGL